MRDRVYDVLKRHATNTALSTTSRVTSHIGRRSRRAGSRQSTHHRAVEDAVRKQRTSAFVTSLGAHHRAVPMPYGAAEEVLHENLAPMPSAGSILWKEEEWTGEMLTNDTLMIFKSSYAGTASLVRNGSNGCASTSSGARYSVGLRDEAPKVVCEGGVTRHRLVLDGSSSCESQDDDMGQRLAALEAECNRLRAQLRGG